MQFSQAGYLSGGEGRIIFLSSYLFSQVYMIYIVHYRCVRFKVHYKGAKTSTQTVAGLLMSWQQERIVSNPKYLALHLLSLFVAHWGLIKWTQVGKRGNSVQIQYCSVVLNVILLRVLFSLGLCNQYVVRMCRCLSMQYPFWPALCPFLKSPGWQMQSTDHTMLLLYPYQQLCVQYTHRYCVCWANHVTRTTVLFHNIFAHPSKDKPFSFKCVNY